MFETDDPGLIGMVHLPPLPGSPGFEGSRSDIVDRAVADATALERGGFDAVLVENFGDRPFHPESVPKHVVASMTAVGAAVTDAVDIPVGFNVLRNDASAALSIASALEASFIRVNVHTGASVTDQGIIEGMAHETQRLRAELGTDVDVWADVDVKHAAPLDDRPLEDRIAESVDRGLADAVIVSGVGTGEPPATEDVKRAAEATIGLERHVPVVVGSGVTAHTAPDLLESADGAIVGTALKAGNRTANPVDAEAVAELVAEVKTG